ncbi:MAG: glycosyltransferase family 4 protein [Acidimicrobiales bacterium]
MRLALLTDRPHSNYGAELNLLAVGELARDAGHDVVAVSIAPGVFIDGAAERGFDTLVVPIPDGLEAITAGGLQPSPGTLWAMARFGRTIHQRMRRQQVDVVMASSMRMAAMTWPGRLRRPHLIWYIQMLTDPSPGTGFTGMVANRIATIAPGVDRSVPAPVRWLRRRRIANLPPWRDSSAFASDDRPDREAGHLRVVTVGKVTPRKGVDLLVTAVAAAREEGIDADLTVVGAPSGPDDEAYAAEIDAHADHLGVPVDWAGWHDDVAPFLRAADTFALVSEREGLPGAALEAMAAGLPLVVTNTGPIAELVDRSRCGLVAETAEPDVIARHLVTIARDPNRGAQMASNSIIAARGFGPDGTKAAIDAILNDMAPRSARPSGANPPTGAPS